MEREAGSPPPTQPPMLSLHGYPEVVRAGSVVPLRLKRGLALLAFLAIEQRTVGRDALAALLWPDALPGVGRGRLRRLVHEVNATLDAAVLDADADTLRLGAGISSDLDATRAALQRGDLAMLAEPRAGDLLAGFTLDSDAFDDWLDASRRDWRSRVQRALERGLDRAASGAPSSTDAPSLAAAAQALLRLDACSEAGHAACLHLAAARGDGAALEAAYFEAARQWREEFGLKPSARIEAAYAAARQRLPRAGFAPPIEFASTPHGDIAHRWWDSAGPDRPVLVVLWALFTNLEVALDEPRLRAVIERLAERHRVVCFDRRGMGLSERVGLAPDVASAGSDVLALLDHRGVDRAWLFGAAVGGTVAIDLALRRPDRLNGLLLYGTSSSGRWSPATPWALKPQDVEAWIERFADPARYLDGLRRFAPSAADDAHVQAWYARMLRNATSRGGVRELLRAFHATDLHDRLGQLQVPTLVMQRRGDRVVPQAAGEQLARHIPGAELVLLDGEDHFLWHGDSAAVVEAIERFVDRHPP